MLNKTLLGIAIAASVVSLTGCKTGGDTSVDLTAVNSGSGDIQAGDNFPIFSAARRELPLNTDLLFSTAAVTWSEKLACFGYPLTAILALKTATAFAAVWPLLSM